MSFSDRDPLEIGVQVFLICFGGLFCLVGGAGWLYSLLMLGHLTEMPNLGALAADTSPIQGSGAAAAQGRPISVTGQLYAKEPVGAGAFLKPQFIFLNMQVSYEETHDSWVSETDSQGNQHQVFQSSSGWFDHPEEELLVFAKEVRIDGLAVDLQKIDELGGYFIGRPPLDLEPSMLGESTKGSRISQKNCLIEGSVKRCFSGLIAGQIVTIFGRLVGDSIVPEHAGHAPRSSLPLGVRATVSVWRYFQSILAGQRMPIWSGKAEDSEASKQVDEVAFFAVQTGDRATVIAELCFADSIQRMGLRSLCFGLSWLGLISLLFGTLVLNSSCLPIANYMKLVDDDNVLKPTFCGTMITSLPVILITIFSPRFFWVGLGPLFLILAMIWIHKKKADLIFSDD